MKSILAWRRWLPAFLLLLSACLSSPAPDPALAQAKELAQRFLIADGHVDLPYQMKIKGFRLAKTYLDPAGAAPEGDFDYPRARAGGLDAPFMSIFIPSDRQQRPGAAKALADSLITMIENLTQQHPDKFVLARSPEDLEAAFAAGLIALPLGMENGAALEDDLDLVAYFYARGIRYITLTHGRDNLICDSSYDTTRTWNGLSPFGEAVVREMNRLGIMVDISHVSDQAFYDVLAITETPPIASHSSARHFTPAFERNMDDDMIRRLGEREGLIMINFGSTFLDSLSRQRFDAMDSAVNNWARTRGIGPQDSAYRAYQAAYLADHDPFAHVSRVADHIDHVVRLIGVDHVGFGSDFDGVGDSLPTGLKDVAGYPNLIAELLRRGYSEADIEKICGGNLLRVWRAVARHAAGSQG